MLILRRRTLFIVYIFFWVSFVINNSSNSPIMDDYNAILQFLCNYINADSDIFQKVKLVLSRHNEHPIVAVRAIVLINQ